MPRPVVACYTCPLWHASAHYESIYGPGWSEYVLMRGARPWFPGHHQPRTPLLGELDEADPETWRVYVDLAADHGVDAFVWDWYWYSGEPALHEALEQGFLRARNRQRVRFAVMWTNHPWMVLYPTARPGGGDAYPRVRDAPDDEPSIRRSLAYVVSRYLHLPGYWTLDGRPVLVFWDGARLRTRLGDEGVRRLLADLRALARSLGHDGLWLHHDCTLAAAYAPGRAGELVGDLRALGFDSVGLYAPVVSAGLRRPQEERTPRYDDVAADIPALWEEIDGVGGLPAFPAVGPGWDSAPRSLGPAAGGDARAQALVVVDETPAAFERLVRQAVDWVQARPDRPPVVTIGCWNEWTEGQYLLPDTRHGHGMLKALAAALGLEDATRYAPSPAGELPHLER